MEYTQHTSTTETIHIPYSFQCEKCGKQHAKTLTIPGGVGVAIMSEKAAQRRALDDVRKRIAKFKNAADRDDYSWLPSVPCPDCSYTQSWQVKALKSELRGYGFLGIVLVIALDILCITVLVLTKPNFLLWLSAGLALVGTIMLVGYLIRKSNRIRRMPRAPHSLKPNVEWPEL